MLKTKLWIFLHRMFLACYALSNLLMMIFGHFSFLCVMLAWNVLPAFLPVLFARRACEKFSARERKKSWLFFAVLWLLFWPNSFYMATDVIHLSGDAFHTLVPGQAYVTPDQLSYTTDLTLWAKMLLIVLGILYATFTGVVSFHEIAFCWQRRFGRAVRLFSTVICALLGGLAVYIGRFLRLNSWDFFRLADMRAQFINTGHSFGFTCAFIAQFACCILLLLGFTRLFFPLPNAEKSII